jgi:hypothetical protein
MSTEFKVGEVVDITIKGVRVRHVATDGIVTIWDDEDRCFSMPPKAVITPADIAASSGETR